MIRRRLFNFASAVSLLLCLAVAVVWTVTLRIPNGMYIARPGGNLYYIGGQRGRIEFAALRPWPSGEFRFAGNSGPSITAKGVVTQRNYGHLVEIITASGSLAVGADGLAVWRTGWSAKPLATGNQRPVTFGGVAVPARILLMLSASLPVAWLILRAVQALRARLPKPGECRRCRYNLTANTSGVCPECGTAVPQNTRTVA